MRSGQANRAFHDRVSAGRALAAHLLQLRARWTTPLVVMALPRGGVPVAAEVARLLGAPMDLLLVRKIGGPWQPELAVAAVVEGQLPQTMMDERMQRDAGIDAAWIDAQAREARIEVARRRPVYLHGRPPRDVAGRTLIVVDDGVATGTTMRAALKALRMLHPARLAVAVPLAPPETVAELQLDADEVICLVQLSPFHAVGLHYDEFHQVGDDEVLRALERARRPTRAAPEARGAGS